VHPVEHDLWRPVPPGRDVARHLILAGPGEAKVEDAQLAVLVHSDVGRFQVLKVKDPRYQYAPRLTSFQSGAFRLTLTVANINHSNLRKNR
jgi:hypothetical protein